MGSWAGGVDAWNIARQTKSFVCSAVLEAPHLHYINTLVSAPNLDLAIPAGLDDDSADGSQQLEQNDRGVPVHIDCVMVLLARASRAMQSVPQAQLGPPPECNNVLA